MKLLLISTLIFFTICSIALAAKYQTLSKKDSNLTPCVPTFKDGGGPYYQPNSPFRTNLAPPENNGEKLVVSGKVLSANCQTPLPGVVVDIWHASESGNYEAKWYRGRVTTSDKGEYLFESVLPLGYGEGTANRPPHLHFKIWRGESELITSQMFLPESAKKGIDPAYIISLDSTKLAGVPIHYGHHDIVLAE